ncbi:MAG: VCBS repeat-containing protein [Rhodothermales bacterium]
MPDSRTAFLFGCTLLLAAGCAPDGADAPRSTPPVQEPLFAQLVPARTGIDFQNTLLEHPSPLRTDLLNEYFSNGAGVAVGDVNGDGLEDLYFTGNMTYGRLYLNRGGLTFEDVTEVAGVAGRKDTWKTGAAMADVDGDGRLDLYVSYSGELPLDRRVDELYINKGNEADGTPRFEEQAAAFGLANPHSTNQAHFFDYDRDGDLDLFLIGNNTPRTPYQDPMGTREELEKDDPVHGNRLYRNDAGRFTDVTRRAGIRSSPLTYSLGAGVADLDNDGWMDLYVGNDYSPPDYLYRNNGDGTFTDVLADRIGHIANASMGVDVADLNNDGWSDIVVLDMLGATNARQKTQFAPNDRDGFDRFLASGFHAQYTRNMLQLNTGDGRFSEIGQLAGVHATDWSWAPLIADFDNDGWKDLFITNGILHDTIDRDFLAFKHRYVQRKPKLEPADIQYLMDVLPATDLANYAFRNTGDLRFDDASAAWGLGAPLRSTGAAYADLDNDGDLDLVTNNVNEYASIFENRAERLAPGAYLQVVLHGAGANTAGIGARVTLYAGVSLQVAEQMPMRGYLSSVSQVLHFGLGNREAVDSLRVRWPDGRSQTLRNVAGNRRIELRQEEAEAAEAAEAPAPLFEATRAPIDFTHRMAGAVDDFRRQPLMVEPASFDGPPLAAGDVDGDGLPDLFVGGGGGQAGQVHRQRAGGRFERLPTPDFEADRYAEDTAALFFDADGDGDLDLYVGSGGYGLLAPDDETLQDRLYLNDGRGRLTRRPDALPAMRTSTGAVAAGDVNGDGALDLFVGGRVVPGRYPEPPRSYLLVNDGNGRFADRTADAAPGLERPGMVTDAAWHDLDGDGTDELVVVGSWMPIRVFERADRGLVDATARYFDAPRSGLWTALRIADLDGDGRPDLLAGNYGTNTQLQAPVELYFSDYDNNRTVDPLLTFPVQGVPYPFPTLEELRTQAPSLASRFPDHGTYAGATLADILSPEQQAASTPLEANTLETSLFLGTASGRFVQRALPIQAQFAPVFAIETLDADGDGALDLLLAGNLNEAPIRLGKNDASYGVLLRGDGAGGYYYVPQPESGLGLRGEVRSIVRVGEMLLFGRNRGTLLAYRPAR